MIATTLLSVVVTGATAWMVFGQDKVTRSEMVEFVSTASPWAADRAGISAILAAHEKGLTQLREMVDRLVSAQSEMVAEQRVLNERYSTILRGLERQTQR